GPTYDFDTDRVAAFTRMARANGLGLISMASLGKKLRSVTTIEGLKNALSGYKISKCSIQWQSRVYIIESDGASVQIKEDKQALTPLQQTINTASLAITRLKAARAVAYASCFQSAITTILQMAGSALVINRAVKRMFGTRTAAMALEGPGKEHNCRVHKAKEAGKGPIGHDDMVERFGLCETEEEESEDQIQMVPSDAVPE
nr:p22 [Norovirus GI]